jgi:hypothetical protein
MLDFATGDIVPSGSASTVRENNNVSSEEIKTDSFSLNFCGRKNI